MRRLLPPFLICLSAWVHAAPPDGSPDEMLPLIQEKGLMSHLGGQLLGAGEQVGAHASELVVRALGFLGVPYRYGGASAENGVDCSGLVKTVYEQALGMVLPHRADQQAAVTQTIDRSQLQPGDLVFFNTMRRAFSHVGIYLGDGKFIHSPRAGASVRIEDMRLSYWTKRFNGARRVPGAPAEAANLPVEPAR